MVRPLGIEEELLLFSPETREAVPAAPQVIKRFREHGPGREHAGGASEELDHELFRHQLEIRTDPTTDAGEALARLVAARRTAGTAARAAGLAAGASGIVPLGTAHSLVTAGDRYLDMLHTFGDIARAGGTCGMHVHVEIRSAEEGIAVIDRIAPWLPVLLALSANSPFADRRDTGYASWRSQVWARWPSAGPTEQFGSLEGYREVSGMLLESGAARDEGMLYFDARLSAAHPTVEVRVCDVCTDPADAVVVAVLVRALVETSATAWAEGRAVPHWRAEALRAAHWRASRFGLSETLVHPVLRERRPAREVLDALVAAVEPALAEAGDLDRVARHFDRVLHENGAARQRAAYERTGTIEGVVDDLIARTEQSWDRRDTAAERA